MITNQEMDTDIYRDVKIYARDYFVQFQLNRAYACVLTCFFNLLRTTWVNQDVNKHLLCPRKNNCKGLLRDILANFLLCLCKLLITPLIRTWIKIWIETLIFLDVGIIAWGYYMLFSQILAFAFLPIVLFASLMVIFNPKMSLSSLFSERTKPFILTWEFQGPLRAVFVDSCVRLPGF